MNEDDLAKIVIKDMAINSLKKSYKIYGLEGTEEKIKELYKNSQGIMGQLLNQHYLLLRGE